MSIEKLVRFLNRTDLTPETIDRAFESAGRDIGLGLGEKLLEQRPADGFSSRASILKVSGIGPKRLQQMLTAAGRRNFGAGEVRIQPAPDRLAAKVGRNPKLIPSFRADVPLGLSDDMLELVHRGAAAVPTLAQWLGPDNPAQLRKAAVAMLGYIDTPEAEALLREALTDPVTRAEALVVLPNYNMRNPDGPRASDVNFLFDPDSALQAVLPYIEDETEAQLDSGFVVYAGPMADLALGAAVRLAGPQQLANLIEAPLLATLGLIPEVLDAAIKAILLDFFRRIAEAARSAAGLTNFGQVVPTTKNDQYTLSFTPKKDACPCTKLAWIQICRGTLPGGGVGYAAGERARDSDKDGWLIDRLDGHKNPVYGSGNDAAGTIPAGKGQYGKTKDGAKPAVPAKLTDRPSGPVGTKFEFESCVFCLEGKCAGKCYGCYRWTCVIQPGGKPKYTPGGSADKPSAQFKKCAEEWNKLPGKTDTPDPAKW